MDDVAAVDASPLIVLGAIQRADLLRCAGLRIVVPESVAREIRALGDDEPAARALATFPWIVRVPDPPIAPEIQAWDLGAGEAAVLSLAASTRGTVAVLDDLGARRCAVGVGAPVIGTVGLVIRARRLGLLTVVRPVLVQLRDAGMWLSDDVVERAAASVGE